MNFYIRRAAPAHGAAAGRIATVVLAAALLGVALSSSRAATITIDPTTLSGVGAESLGGYVPTALDSPNGDFKVISYFNAGDYVDLPFTVPTGQGGVYSASALYGTPNPIAPDVGGGVAISLDIRKAGTEAHVASQDIPLAPTGVDESAYEPTVPFTAAGFDLAPGDYVLRIRNVSQLHTTISNRSSGYQYRNEIGNAARRDVNIGPITLTSTGALPATGTISGKVTASDLGYGVGSALVLAVAPGQEVGEPSPFWYAGHWTLTDASGNYSLTVPAGTYTVQTGRPDSYQLAGVRTTGVAVASGATVATNLSLPSKWTATTGTGALQVEQEYFFNKVADPTPDVSSNSPSYTGTGIDIDVDGNASNQIKLTYTNSGDFVDNYVDVPTGQAGAYDLSATYTSFPGGSVQFIANPGGTDENNAAGDLVNSGMDPNDPGKGYYVSATVAIGSITLHAGRNVVRELLVSGGVDFDAFQITRHVASGADIANPKDANFSYVIGEKEPGGQVTYPIKVGNTITQLQRGSYVEIPMTFDAAGLFKAVFTTRGYGPAPLIQLDLRPAGSDAHYATDDIAVPAVSSADSTNTVTNLPVFQAGDYILRVRNTTQFHTTTSTRLAFDSYGANGFIPNRLDFGQIVFTKTGALPATGTVSGTVKSADLGSVGSGQVFVMANPTGADVPEPSSLWQKGFWAMADANGAYTFPVLAGAYDVQAGSPDEYAFNGGLATATVAGGATATANVNLPSRVTQDAGGHYLIPVETEYFIGKPADSFGSGYPASIIALQRNATAGNQIILGFTDVGDYVDLPVDVPAGAGGAYTLTDYYYNGYYIADQYPAGTVDFTANLGTGNENTIEDTQPNTAPAGQPSSAGYGTQGIKVFGQPITLLAGHNTIRIKLAGGSSNFDAFTLTSTTAFALPASAAQALRIAGGLALAPTPVSGAAFTSLDANGDHKITLADAVTLAKQGHL